MIVKLLLIVSFGITMYSTTHCSEIDSILKRNKRDEGVDKGGDEGSDEGVRCVTVHGKLKCCPLKDKDGNVIPDGDIYVLGKNNQIFHNGKQVDVTLSENDCK